MPVTVDIPKKAEQQKPKQTQTEYTKGSNFADKEETVAKVLERASASWGIYDGQSARRAMETLMKKSDAMLRMAANQTKQDENKTRDEVDIRPDIFLRNLRSITANEIGIYFGDKDRLPVKYEPLTGLDDETRTQTKELTEQQNLLHEYSWELDNRKQKICEAIYFLNKYSNGVFGMEWKTVKHTIRERRPTALDAEGNPASYKWKTAERDESHPEWVRYPLDQVWFDATIDDLQSQQCILLEHYPTLSDLKNLERTKSYINVGKLTTAQLLQRPASEVKDDRQSNAGESGDFNATSGLFHGWHVWLQAPIDADGKWDDVNTWPSWYLATFIGDLKDNPVCVRLVKNPYAGIVADDEIPYQLAHSHRDDKGAYHMGFVDIQSPAYDEYKTALDQWYDNKNLVNSAPMITEQGAILTNDKTFGPRRLFEMQFGQIEKLKRLEIPSNTQDMGAHITYLEQRCKESMGVTRPFLGEAMGGRTSASEARTVFEQAMRPTLDKAEYVGDQLFKFEAKWDAALWRQFSKPEQVVALTRQGIVYEIKPAHVWGPLRYKVVAVEEFERNSVMRLEQDRFIQVTLPMAAPIMGRKGLIATLKHIYQSRDFPVDDMFPRLKETDARHVARSENKGFVAHIFDEPKEGEDHDTHLDEHESFERTYRLLPATQRDEETLSLVREHIETTNQLRDKEQAGIQQGAQQATERVAGMGQGESPPQTEGQAMGDLMGAEGGAIG